MYRVRYLDDNYAIHICFCTLAEVRYLKERFNVVEVTKEGRNVYGTV